jgi:hypothetical protein
LGQLNFTTQHNHPTSKQDETSICTRYKHLLLQRCIPRSSTCKILLHDAFRSLHVDNATRAASTPVCWRCDAGRDAISFGHRNGKMTRKRKLPRQNRLARDAAAATSAGECGRFGLAVQQTICNRWEAAAAGPEGSCRRVGEERRSTDLGTPSPYVYMYSMRQCLLHCA